MATTAGNLIDETIDLLYGMTSDRITTTTGALDASTTTVPVTVGTGIEAGGLIAIDLEVMYVVSRSSLNVTVVRGFRGSTAATHASGATVVVNPKFSRFSILKALNADLNDLSSEGLGKFTTVEQTYNPAIEGYDITSATAVDEVMSVRYQDVGPEKEWPMIPRDLWSWSLRSETDDFASGFSLVVKGYAAPGRQLRIVYRSPFTAFTAESDDAQTSAGLPATANDLPPLGAAIRLIYPREARRNFTEAQGDTRRAEEVPPGANLNAAQGWGQLRAGRIVRELQRQERQYPVSRY